MYGVCSRTLNKIKIGILRMKCVKNEWVNVNSSMSHEYIYRLGDRRNSGFSKRVSEGKEFEFGGGEKRGT